MRVKEFFPIRELEAQSGVKSSTLRAWERRYGLIKPNRTPKGHRLYSQSDLSRVLRIKELLGDGHSFTSIKKIINHANVGNEAEIAYTNVWSEAIANIKNSVSDFSYNRMDNFYNDIVSLYPVDLVSEKLLQPLLQYYSQESAEITELSFFNKWLQIRLSSRFHHDNIKNKNAKKVIFVSDFNKETSLMMMSNMIITLGYQALFFGSLLPYNKLKKVSEKSASKAIFTAPSKIQVKDPQFLDFINKSDNPVFIFGDFDKQSHFEIFEPGNVYYLGSSMPVAVNLFRKHMLNIYHE